MKRVEKGVKKLKGKTSVREGWEGKRRTLEYNLSFLCNEWLLGVEEKFGSFVQTRFRDLFRNVTKDVLMRSQ